MNILEDPRYVISRFRSVDLNSIAKLYQKIYPSRKKSLTYFSYRFLMTTYGKPIIYLMGYENQIVGLYAVHPVHLMIKNKPVLCGFTYLTMTDPDHSGKGIMTKLALKTFDEVKVRKYNFIYGFPNSNSYPGFVKKLGYIKNMKINHVKINRINFDSNEKVNIYNHWFPKNVGKIWENYVTKKKFLICRDRNNDLINWRFKNNPSVKYLTCYKPHEYFFIFKKYGSALHIIDFLIIDDSYLKTLLTTAFYVAKKKSCKELTMWIPKDHPIMQILKKEDIEYLEPQSFFTVRPFNKALLPVVSNIKNWYYTMGDSDIF